MGPFERERGSLRAPALRPLGIEPAARQFRLDFIPLGRERYMLTCRNASLAQPAVNELCALLAGENFARAMASVAGYEPDCPGEVVEAESVFPWLAKEGRT